MADDYYDILGIDRSATTDEIKRAYRKKAHQHHPDKDSGNESEFKKVNAAYQVLSDADKRAQYDRFGNTAESSAGAGGFSGFHVNVDDFGGMGDIFEQFFGGRRAGGTERVRRGEDIQIDVTISLNESASGVAKDVATRLYQTCSQCSGNGAEPGTPIETCGSCHGSGTVNTTRQTILGTIAQTVACPVCHGEGKRAKTACSGCRGEGRQLKDRTLEISIPAGIADRQTIRLSGKGNAPSRGGLPGDLYVTIHVQESKFLRRDGNNVRSNCSISFIDASLGTKIAIDSLVGETTLVIPPGTQPGTEIRLNGLGFRSLSGGGVGDYLVTVNVKIPTRLSKKQKQMLKDFGNAKFKFFG